MTSPNAPRVDVEYLLKGTDRDYSSSLYFAIKDYVIETGDALEIKMSRPDKESLYIKVGKEVFDALANAAKISHMADELHQELQNRQHHGNYQASQVFERSVIGIGPSGVLPDPE